MNQFSHSILNTFSQTFSSTAFKVESLSYPWQQCLCPPYTQKQNVGWIVFQSFHWPSFFQDLHKTNGWPSVWRPWPLQYEYFNLGQQLTCSKYIKSDLHPHITYNDLTLTFRWNWPLQLYVYFLGFTWYCPVAYNYFNL